MSDEQRLAEIRTRTSPQPDPLPCPVCGADRAIGSCAWGRVKWACYSKAPDGGFYDTEHHARSIVYLDLPDPDTDFLLAQIDRLRSGLAASEAARAALVEALQRLIDVDMGLRDQISRYLPDGAGLVLQVRGIMAVQAAKEVLAAQPAAPAPGESEHG